MSIDIEYCLGIGASSKVDNALSAQKINDALQVHHIQFSYIATLDKFADSIWLSYLKTQFSAKIIVFPIDFLAQYQSKLLTPSHSVFQAIGCHGIAEAAALAAFVDNSKLIIPKTICCGFTYAITQRG